MPGPLVCGRLAGRAGGQAAGRPSGRAAGQGAAHSQRSSALAAHAAVARLSHTYSGLPLRYRTAVCRYAIVQRSPARLLSNSQQRFAAMLSYSGLPLCYSTGVSPYITPIFAAAAYRYFIVQRSAAMLSYNGLQLCHFHTRSSGLPLSSILSYSVLPLCLTHLFMTSRSGLPLALSYYGLILIGENNTCCFSAISELTSRASPIHSQPCSPSGHSPA